MNAPNISRRVWHFALTLILLAGFLLPVSGVVHATDTRVINLTLPANFNSPPWWSGTHCDSDNYDAYIDANYPGYAHAALLSTSPDSIWRNIEACGPQPQSQSGVNRQMNFGGTGNPIGADQFEFECAELAKRYLYLAYGVNPIPADGNEVAYQYSHTPNGYPDKFQYFENGVDSVLPQEGDVISFSVSGSSAGHVAIVTALYADSSNPGNGYIELMDQNGSDGGYFRLSIEDYLILDHYGEEASTGFTPEDWIHPLVGINNSPTTTYATSIYGADTVGADVWIAGYEVLSGSTERTVTWHWNGVSWDKWNPPTVTGSNWGHWLYDIAIGGNMNGDVYTVGKYQDVCSGVYCQPSLIFKWVPQTHTWMRITSDTVYQTNNQLNAVANAGTDQWYAGGYVYKRTTPTWTHPYLLKWNGTKFADQNLALPSGVTYGVITDISFSSSSNGWLVGSIGGYAYHFDGTSFNPVQLPTGMSVNKVKAVSDTEAWAIGYYSSEYHIWHYTDNNGWQEAIGIIPTGKSVTSIDADGINNVWVGGGNGGQPFYMRYDGSSWYQVAAPTLPYAGAMRDIAVDDQFVVGAGDRQSTSYSGSIRYPFVQFK